MDDRFVAIVCEMRGVATPHQIRMRELERIVQSQLFEQTIEGGIEKILYEQIFEEAYDEEFEICI